LVGGHGGDPGLLLAEEQHQAAGDPVGGVEPVVVEQLGYQCPAVLGVGRGIGVRWGVGTVNWWQCPRSLAQGRKSRTWQVEGLVVGQWSMSAWWQSVSVVLFAASQVRKLAAVLIFSWAWAV
jgi:hypothetical protein